MSDEDEYGICANVEETDRVFRKGAKAWIAGGAGGEGFTRFEWIALSRGGRSIRKWASTHRFSNFRAKWIPEHLREDIHGAVGTRGSREAMERLAAALNTFVADERGRHPNRRAMRRHETGQTA